LSREELGKLCLVLFVAGHETTTNLIGNGMKALLEDPGELHLLVDRPDRTKTAIEELLRFDPPAHCVARVATADVEAGGHAFRPGQQAVVFVGAANRDPNQFVRPDKLDLARSPNPHLSFGHGLHHCLGASLARVEGHLAIQTLVSRFPSVALAEAPEYREH